MWWQRGILSWLAKLDIYERRAEDNRESKEQGDAEVRPRVSRSTPLKGEDETDDGGDEEGRSQNVEVGELFFPRQSGLGRYE